MIVAARMAKSPSQRRSTRFAGSASVTGALDTAAFVVAPLATAGFVAVAVAVAVAVRECAFGTAFDRACGRAFVPPFGRPFAPDFRAVGFGFDFDFGEVVDGSWIVVTVCLLLGCSVA